MQTQGINVDLSITNITRNINYDLSQTAMTIKAGVGDDIKVKVRVCDSGHIYAKYRSAGYKDNEMPNVVPCKLVVGYFGLFEKEQYSSLALYSCNSSQYTELAITFTIPSYKNYTQTRLDVAVQLQYPPGSTWVGVYYVSLPVDLANPPPPLPSMPPPPPEPIPEPEPNPSPDPIPEPEPQPNVGTDDTADKKLWLTAMITTALVVLIAIAVGMLL